jgi:hypothetical protein
MATVYERFRTWYRNLQLEFIGHQSAEPETSRVVGFCGVVVFCGEVLSCSAMMRICETRTISIHFGFHIRFMPIDMVEKGDFQASLNFPLLSFRGVDRHRGMWAVERSGNIAKPCKARH